MENNNQQESEKETQDENQKDSETAREKKFITPREVQFYLKSSWYLLAVLLISEFIMMFAFSKAEWSNENFTIWLVRIIILCYIFWRIGKKFKQINSSLFGSILGFETGLIVAIAKIVINSGAQWTWFNLFTEPFYLMGLGAFIGFVTYSLNNTKRN
jgi:cation transport ATPase